MANDLIGWLVLGVIAGLAASGSVSITGFGATVIGMVVPRAGDDRRPAAGRRHVAQRAACDGGGNLAGGAVEVTLIVVLAGRRR